MNSLDMIVHRLHIAEETLCDPENTPIKGRSRGEGQHQAFDTVAKMSFEIVTSHVRVPRFKFHLCFWFQVPDNIHDGRQKLMSQGLRSLLPTWVVHTCRVPHLSSSFLSSLGLALLTDAGLWGNEPVNTWSLCPFLPISLSLCLPNKY